MELRFFANGLLNYQHNLEICQAFIVMYFFFVEKPVVLFPQSFTLTQTGLCVLDCPRPLHPD